MNCIYYYVKYNQQPVPVRIPSQRSLTPSVASVTSVGLVMRCYRGLCSDLLAFTLKLRKTQLGDRRWKLCDQSSPQMGSITSKWGRQDRTARQEGDGSKERLYKGIPITICMRWEASSSSSSSPCWFRADESLLKILRFENIVKRFNILLLTFFCLILCTQIKMKIKRVINYCAAFNTEFVSNLLLQYLATTVCSL